MSAYNLECYLSLWPGRVRGGQEMFGLTVRVTTMPVMKAAARSLLIALMMMAPGPAVFGLGFGPALADGKAEICPSCNQDGTWTNPSTGTTSGPSNVPATPTPEQIRAAERDRLNDLGGDACSQVQEGLCSFTG